ncbi:hypothetical protein IV102_34815 [bacterium]|nr:hypothetical protein [bacterium]
MGTRTPQAGGSVARVIAVQFGRLDGLFGLHLWLEFSSNQVESYSLTDLSEIEELMDSFQATTADDLVQKKLRIRSYPPPVPVHS